MLEELIKINKTKIGNEEVNSVDMKDVYNYLKIKKDYTSWVKAQIKRGMFDENMDFITYTQKGEGGKFDSAIYICTLDMAKSVCLLSQTAKGKEVRKYFIQVEKVAKNLLGEQKLNLELKKLETEELLLQEDIINKRVARVQLLQSMGVNFDATTLIDSGKCKSILNKDMSEALTNAYSDIRTGVQVFSATHLLNLNKVWIKTKDFNDAMIQAGLMETYTYKSSTYKKLVKDVSYYGYNRDSSSRTRFPLATRYYEDRFMELVQMLRNEGYID